MQYRTLNDLSALVNQCGSQMPRDIELIVGVTRGGMLLGSMLSLKSNLPLTDLRSFQRNEDLDPVTPRQGKPSPSKPHQARKVLLVDSSIATGKTMASAREAVASCFDGDVVTLAGFVNPENVSKVDICLEALPLPRFFEWSIMHHEIIGHACLDIDGVLCVDPTHEQNDDGERYIDFLKNAAPLHIPTTQALHLVTSRLEKYRKETEEWLERNGVQYGKLHMLNMASAEERRRANAHHVLKAEVYKNDPNALLFIESEPRQAVEILRISGKPVFCVDTNQMYLPEMLEELLSQQRRQSGFGIKRRIAAGLRLLTSRPRPGPVAA
ncbi:phosphoribosyltransferase [Halopseudomonas nanhaiensis]|uniref:phosphoribosyltransferase family protein n=1 Tax=Halopseudomonas nanhaiensis TaxID=2830842 RepID=UPI001CBC7BA3|nr:phosphoribosyltransferase family protein [Halopseudomonas nanhaiensis]UAW99517.1 phosphoribosyltransferase [Halopseudomonas nanhaiensis]